MPTLIERAAKTKENAVDFAQSKFISFFLWLLMVHLIIEHDEQAQAALDEHLANNPNESVVISIAPHTGHPDSLYVYKAVEKLAPSLIPHLQFVSAKDTWESKSSRMFARLVAGDPYLFDRENSVEGSVKTQIDEMVSILSPEDDAQFRSLAIYPQGTRTIGAQIESMPVTLAQRAEVPIAVLNISGAEQVMPKVDKGKQTAQIFHILLQRVLTRRAKIKEKQHQVRINLADFIPAGKSRSETKKRFLEAHQQQSS